MAIRPGVRVRVLKGRKKEQEATVQEVQEGKIYLEGDRTPYTAEMLQELGYN